MALTLEDKRKIAAWACEWCSDPEWGWEREEAVERLQKDWPDEPDWAALVDEIRPPEPRVSQHRLSPAELLMVQDSLRRLGQIARFAKVFDRNYDKPTQIGDTIRVVKPRRYTR